MKQLARTLRRRTGVAMAEVDRLTPRSPGSPAPTLREVRMVARNARRTLARRPGDGSLGGWSMSWGDDRPHRSAVGPGQAASFG